MSNSYQYNGTTGTIIPDTSNIKEEVTEEYKTALGQDLDVSDSSPAGRLIEVETIARKRVIENMALIANMLNPNQAFGIFLDAIAYLFDVERVGATSTRVICTLTGTPNTIIPANVQAKDTSNNLYYLENQTIIGSDGSTEAYFVAINKGAIECDANSLNQIVTAVTGWDGINNESAGETGKSGESDLELKTNLPTKQYQGYSLLDAIRANVLNVENVESCFVIDNPSGIADTTKVPGKSLPPHSLYVCVDGGSNEDVAKAIFDKKSIGCDYAGTMETVTVKDSDQDYQVSFDRAELKPIYVTVSVNVSNLGGSSNINETAIKNAVVAYSLGQVEGVDGLKIGVNANAFELASAITIQIPELFIEDVKVSDNNSDWSTNVDIAKYERGTISSDNITVIQK